MKQTQDSAWKTLKKNAPRPLLEKFGRPKEPADLAKLPALSTMEHDGAQSWELIRSDDTHATVDIHPNLICGEFNVILQAARQESV